MAASLSCTAPYISEEEEQAELDALSEQERRAIVEDLRGSDPTLAKDEQGKEEAIILVKEALATMPTTSKRALDLAMQIAPQLVETECDVSAYLRATGFDPWKAAQRMADYWEARLLIFGEYRAFMPMTLAGAMAEDVEVLELGIFCHVGSDAKGRAVYHFDRTSPLMSTSIRDSMCMSDSVTAQQMGCVGIHYLSNYNLRKHFDRILVKRIKLSAECMPMTLKALHVCVTSGYSVFELVAPFLKQMLGKYFRQRLVLHRGSVDQVMDGLAGYDLTELAIRERLSGGATGEARMREWLADRRALEEARLLRQGESKA